MTIPEGRMPPYSAEATIPEGRVPPYSKEAEAAVLGAILLNNLSLGKVRAMLQTEDFYIQSHRCIYAAMLDLSQRGEAIDHVTLGTELIKRGELDRVGGPTGLDNLTDTVGTVANVEHYADIVRKKAATRSMIYAAMQVVADGFAGNDTAEDYLNAARSSVIQAAHFVSGAGPQRIDADLSSIWHDLQQPGDPPGIVKTGIDAIDRTTGGLWPGLLYIVAGRPGMGKSAVGINLATNAALGGYRVLYVTLEDVRQFVVRRMLARFSDVDLHDLNLRRVKTPEQWKRITDAVSHLSAQHPLWIEDMGGLTSDAVAQIAASHQAIHGLDLLVVDHLGEYADKGESETSITTRSAQRTRDIAKELNIPVVLLSQLNRKVEERSDRRPVLSDLRQSGAIEQLARAVWFLYRPAYYLPDDEAEGRHDLHLIVAKSSHGITGTVRLWVDLSRMYVRSWEPGDGPWPDAPINAPVQKSKQDYFGGGSSKKEPHWQDDPQGDTEY